MANLEEFEIEKPEMCPNCGSRVGTADACDNCGVILSQQAEFGDFDAEDELSEDY